MEQGIFHIPVLVKEVNNYLRPKQGEIIFDGTLGGAGHTIEIIKVIAPTGKVIGVDLHSQTLSTAANKLKKFSENIIFVNDNFANIKNILENLKIKSISGILLDLGISSYLIEKSGGGFSYLENEKLDMRFDKNQSLTAGMIVNNYDEEELSGIFKKYGEEKFSSTIAKNIVRLRNEKNIQYTGELVEIIRKSIPYKFSMKYGHPAKRVFQALRIAVNDELDSLEKVIDEGFSCLDIGGRMVIISYHSLEDRIVKRKFIELEGRCTCPSEFPICICGRQKRGEILTKKAVKPGMKEISFNPRSKSAKLRAIIKIK